MANWIEAKVTAACGHVVDAKLPEPSFDGEQIHPEKWRKAMETVPCHACYEADPKKWGE